MLLLVMGPSAPVLFLKLVNMTAVAAHAVMIKVNTNTFTAPKSTELHFDGFDKCFLTVHPLNVYGGGVILFFLGV